MKFTKNIHLNKINKLLFSFPIIIVLLICILGFGIYKLSQHSKPESLLHTLKHNKTVVTADFSPDSKYIASGTFGELVFGLFNVTSGNGKLLFGLINHAGTTNIWDVESGKLLHTFSPDYLKPSLVNCVKFSPDSRLLASSSTDGIVRLWDVKSGNFKYSLVHRPPDTSALFNFCS